MKTFIMKFAVVCLVLVAGLAMFTANTQPDSSATGTGLPQRTAQVSLSGGNMSSDSLIEADRMTQELSMLAQPKLPRLGN